ncbi:MAG: radical SAM protein [Candidatus Heimdallarchaeota archaeon]|nr:radical SAM protein [Candidatus Heimdallarchaeota archaeon]
MLRKLKFYLEWAIKNNLKGYRIPVSSSIILTDTCNLNCEYCVVKNLSYEELTFEEVKRDLNLLYSTGARMLAITGGEPYCWRDDKKNLSDVITYAKELGVFRVTLVTNGTFKLKSNADFIWVSLDGLPEEHNFLRDNSYDTIVKNIKRSSHPKIFANFTITSQNFQSIDEAITNILAIENIQGIMFRLFIPYLNTDLNFQLSAKERWEVITKIIQFKKKHPIKVTNTFDGLKALLLNNWERPIWSSVVVNRGELTRCLCRKGISNQETCKNCGSTPAIESLMIQKLKPLALLENLRLL